MGQDCKAIPGKSLTCLSIPTTTRLLNLSRLCCIFIELALLFFLVLFLLRDLLLTLLKTEIRFPHSMPPRKEIYELNRAFIRAGRTTVRPAALHCFAPFRLPRSLNFGLGRSMQRVTATACPDAAPNQMAAVAC